MISINRAVQHFANRYEFAEDGHSVATLFQIKRFKDGRIDRSIASAIHWKATLSWIPVVSIGNGIYNITRYFLGSKKVIHLKREFLSMLPFAGNFLVYRMDQQRIKTFENAIKLQQDLIIYESPHLSADFVVVNNYKCMSRDPAIIGQIDANCLANVFSHIDNKVKGIKA